MADTQVLTGDTETVKRWSTKLWVELPREIYWGKFMKENDMNTIIEVRRDLEGQSGDKLTFSLARKLVGGGVTGDGDLEGSEELMAWSSDSITLDQVRNAVRLKGRLSERRTAFDQRMLAKNLLKTWLAEFIDDDIFTQFDASPAASRTVFGGVATSTATIDSTSTITIAKLQTVVAKAVKATPKVWPVRLDEGDFYLFLAHTDVAFDLQRLSEWQTYNQYAGPREYKSNNLFLGKIGMVGGVVVHAHEKIPISTTYGSAADQPGASNFFLGKQAGIFGWGARPEWWEKEFDYGNKVGFAIGAIWDFKKAVFSAVDNAFFAIRTFRTNN